VHAAGQQTPLPGQPVWTWAPWLTANGFPTLESSGAPTILLPGNHDRFHGPCLHAGGVVFDAIFAGDWNGRRKTQTLIVLQLGKENPAVVAADFTLKRNADVASGAGGPTWVRADSTLRCCRNWCRKHERSKRKTIPFMPANPRFAYLGLSLSMKSIRSARR
jgi:hypothetical protein